ncbi:MULTISPECIES: hypothetical protein [unclassified Gilliamella]|uniref:hypothetical protein n=1 Tax=unclassified Gilliamella TaxID=2685620 RepID=UPI0019213159|nr:MULTISPECIES: hypothetical protein [unclassified Gilliamella]
MFKIEKTIENKLRRQAKRDNKTYPGEMLHVDTKGLSLLKNQAVNTPFLSQNSHRELRCLF